MKILMLQGSARALCCDSISHAGESQVFSSVFGATRFEGFWEPLMEQCLWLASSSPRSEQRTPRFVRFQARPDDDDDDDDDDDGKLGMTRIQIWMSPIMLC